MILVCFSSNKNGIDWPIGSLKQRRGKFGPVIPSERSRCLKPLNFALSTLELKKKTVSTVFKYRNKGENVEKI